MDKSELSRRWRDESLAYYNAINAYVTKGDALNWKNMGKEPKDTRESMADDVIAVLRDANAQGTWQSLREEFPPAHGPFIKFLEAGSRSIPVIALLDDRCILARIGAAYEEGTVVLIQGDEVLTVADFNWFGRSPDRSTWAVARDDGIELRRTWDGPAVAKIPYPTGQENPPDGIPLAAIKGVPPITQLIPFPDGRRVLLVSSDGIYVLSEDHVHRLLPTNADIREQYQYQIKDDSDDVEFTAGLSMEHGALSPDGKLIAIGCQDSSHLIFNQELELVGDVGHLSEYPHYALFNQNATMIAFNSCHFYNGATVGVDTSLLPGLATEPYDEDDRLVTLDQGARVYAGVHRGDEFIIGDASGYLRAFDESGTPRWNHFIGSSVGDIDISPDGKRLVVSTYAGFLCIIDMDTDKHDPFTIGNSTHREQRRWLFWSTEQKPLIW